jgi:hypothetical protein
MLWAGQAAGSIPMLLVGSLALAGADSAYRRLLYRGFFALLAGLFSEVVPPHPALRLSFSVGQRDSTVRLDTQRG